MITVPVLSLAIGAILAYGAVAAGFFAWFGWQVGARGWQIVLLVGLSAACAFALAVTLGLHLPTINFEWR